MAYRRFNLTLPPDLYDEAKEEVDATGRELSPVVQLFLRDWLRAGAPTRFRIVPQTREAENDYRETGAA